MKTSTLIIALAAGAALAGTVRAGEEESIRVRVVERSPCPVVSTEHDGFKMVTQKRGFLGVEMTSLTPDLRRHFGVSEDEGVMIGKVVDDSAAQRSGLQVGDIITGVDGETIQSSWDLTTAIRGAGESESILIEYWRDGSVNQQNVVLDSRETCTFDMSSIATSVEELREALPGLHLRGLEINEEAMEEVMESLGAINWEEHLEKLEKIEIDNIDVRMDELHQRMEELGERLRLEGHEIHLERIRVLEDTERERLEREIEVRTELNRARIEARRQAAEAAERAAEARREAHEHMRSATEAQREAQREAEALLREAAERAEEEGGGSIVI